MHHIYHSTGVTYSSSFVRYAVQLPLWVLGNYQHPGNSTSANDIAEIQHHVFWLGKCFVQIKQCSVSCKYTYTVSGIYCEARGTLPEILPRIPNWVGAGLVMMTRCGTLNQGTQNPNPSIPTPLLQLRLNVTMMSQLRLKKRIFFLFFHGFRQRAAITLYLPLCPFFWASKHDLIMFSQGPFALFQIHTKVSISIFLFIIDIRLSPRWIWCVWILSIFTEKMSWQKSGRASRQN